MEAARRLACVLALHQIPGFEGVLTYLEENRPDEVDEMQKLYSRMVPPETFRTRNVRALHCLCLIADQNIICKFGRKAASNCGGLKPGDGESHPHPFRADWLKWADPDNSVYAKMVNEFIYAKMVNEIIYEVRAQGCSLPAYYQMGYDELVKFNDEQKAQCVEAYFGAADAAQRLYGHVSFHGVHSVPWHREYNCLEGGTFIAGDDNAAYFTFWMKAYHAKNKPPMPWPKSFRDARDAQRADFLSRLAQDPFANPT